MSRAIEFRVYSTVTGSFDYFTIKDLLTKECRKVSEKAFDEDLPVEQFTGLLDCNDVKIFEGDIFSDGINYCIIMFDSETASFVAFDGYERHKLGDHTKREMIIGNIHQNSELLK